MLLSDTLAAPGVTVAALWGCVALLLMVVAWLAYDVRGRFCVDVVRAGESLASFSDTAGRGEGLVLAAVAGAFQVDEWRFDGEPPRVVVEVLAGLGVVLA